MKALLFLLLFLCVIQLHAQQPLPQDEALSQLYQHYDATKKTARWVCPASAPEGVACWDGEDATVSITPLLTAEVAEGDQADLKKIYLVASARPAIAEHYECHMCAPAIGVAVFVWRSDRWVLESKNPAAKFYGSFGKPGDVSLVAVGPHRYGVLLSTDLGGQGYYESTKALLLSLADRVDTVWSLKDRSEDMGDDYDAHVMRSNRLRYHAIQESTSFGRAAPKAT